MARRRSSKNNNSGFFVLAVLGFVTFPFVVPWVVWTADIDTSPVVQYRFKVALALFGLYILSFGILFGLCVWHFDTVSFLFGLSGVVLEVLAIMVLVSMFNWRGELEDFGKACPTNETSSYCDDLYGKMGCTTTSVFQVNKTEVVEGKNITHTVSVNLLSLGTCYNQAKSWMTYSAMIVWAFMYIIIGFVVYIGAIILGFDAIDTIWWRIKSFFSRLFSCYWCNGRNLDTTTNNSYNSDIDLTPRPAAIVTTTEAEAEAVVPTETGDVGLEPGDVPEEKNDGPKYDDTKRADPGEL